MTLRQKLKFWLYGKCPGIAGVFPYFGIRVHFPKQSLLFRLLCEQGVFEAENLELLRTQVKPSTWLFDVGTNIGLMCVPILAQLTDSHVASFEASPNVLPYLERTIAGSGFARRWKLIPKAVGAQVGRVGFNLSSAANSPFDGIRHTNRVPSVRQVEVEMTTIDVEWRGLGSPAVSAIKIDVEGGEIEVLRGASECLRTAKPIVLVEWNAQNLAAYNVSPDALFEFASDNDYEVYAQPHLIEVRTSRGLMLQMGRTESFLLAPIVRTSRNPKHP